MCGRAIVCVCLILAVCGCGGPRPSANEGGQTAPSREQTAAPRSNPPTAIDPKNPSAPGNFDQPYSYREIPLSEDMTGEVAFSADSKQLAVGGANEIRVLTVPDGREVIRIPFPDKKTRYLVAFAPDGKHLISAGPEYGVYPKDLGPADRKLLYWSSETGARVKAVDLPSADEVLHVIGFSPDGKYLAARTFEGITIVETNSGGVATELKGAGARLSDTPAQIRAGWKEGRAPWGVERGNGGAFSPDSKRFAAHAGEGRLAVWDVASGKRLAISQEGPPSSPSDYAGTFITFSPDGRRLASSSGQLTDERVRVWDADTMKLLSQPLRQMHKDKLAWLPDSSGVVGFRWAEPPSYQTHTAAVDAISGRLIHQFYPYPGTGEWHGYSPMLTPDGKYLVFRGHPSQAGQSRTTARSIFFCRTPPAAPRGPNGP
jgi:WD40 repeat protein